MEGPPVSEPKQPVIEERDLEEPSKPSELLDNDLVFLKPPEIEEKDLLSPEERQAQVIEAMKSGNFEVVKEWYADEEKIADQDPSPRGRLDLTMKMAKLQLDAGFHNESMDTLYDAYTDAYQQRDDEKARRLKAIMDQLDE